MAWPQGRCQPRKQKKRFQWIPNRISTRKRNFSSVFPEFLSCECEKARLNPLTWFTLNGKAFSKDFLWTSIKASLFEKPVWCQKLTIPASSTLLMLQLHQVLLDHVTAYCTEMVLGESISLLSPLGSSIGDTLAMSSGHLHIAAFSETWNRTSLVWL